MTENTNTQFIRNWQGFGVLVALFMCISGSAMGDENIKIHEYIPPGDLAESALQGKAINYTYHSAVSVTPYGEGDYEAIGHGETVDLIFEKGTCTWFGVKGKFAGDTEKMACGQTEVAPGVYFVTWLESTGQNVSMVINTKAKTVNSSYLAKGPRGLDNMEFLEAVLNKFGSIEEIRNHSE